MSESKNKQYGANVPDSSKKAESQVEKFRELARKIGTIDSEEPLNAALRKVVKTTTPQQENKKKKEE
ncbi:hypothetical protein ACFSOZ_04280 [Mesorhizobium newzealandense]|uniref:Uncharacterized protein n=1 Tax=Mesorhizobium newzealandense TaxID=1300302 RepID=A0ABW4U311_9HYPH